MAKKSNDNKVVAALNQQVANWTVLFTKLHNYHWYVKDLTSSVYMRSLKRFIMKQVRISMNLRSAFLQFKVIRLQHLKNHLNYQ